MTTAWSNQLASLRRIALDTNALIYGLQNQDPFGILMQEAFHALEKGALSATVSAIVEMETLVKPLRERDQNAIDRVDRFFREMRGVNVRSVDRIVARRAAGIRARTALPAPDSIIAATALEERCDALVGNDEAFARRFPDLPYLLLQRYTREGGSS